MGKSGSQGNGSSQVYNPVDKNGVRLPSSIYFGGCAWGSAFYVGVYKAMCEVLMLMYSTIVHVVEVLLPCSAGLAFKTKY